MKKIIMLSFVIIISCLNIKAQINSDTIPVSDTTAHFTLKELQDYAIANSIDAKNAELEIKKAKNKKWETTAIGLPQAKVELNYQYIFDVPVMEMPISFSIIPDASNPFNHMHMDTTAVLELGKESSTNIDFTVSQLLFSGEYIVGLKAAKIYLSMSKKGLIKKKLEVKESITKTYYLVLIAEESLKVLDSIRDAIAKIYNETNKMYEAGFAESTDVDQIKLNLKNTENSIISFNNQRDILYRLLKFQANINPMQEVSISGDISEITDSLNQNVLLAADFSVGQNIDYQIIEVQEKLYKLDWQRERTTYLPTVAAFYRHQEQINAPDFNFNPPDVIGIRASIPILTSGSRHAKIQQKKIELEQIKNKKQQAADGLLLEVQRTKSEFDAAFNNLKNRKESKLLAKKIYSETLIKFKAGIESSFILTQNQSQYFKTLSDYYMTLSNLLDIQVKLKKLLNLL